MPEFDSTTLTKLADLRTLHPNGAGVEVDELVEIDWPSPDGTIYYAVEQTDETSSTPPSVTPIDCRIRPIGRPELVSACRPRCDDRRRVDRPDVLGR
jgi:hypothetical protein